jgi:hypothetical protein
MGLVSIGSGWALAQLLHDDPAGWAMQIVLTGGVGLGMYGALVRVACPRDWNELLGHVRGLLQRGVGVAGPRRKGPAPRW